ncbi:HVA22-like protein k [Striga hermonthica]|uniref:HVA22-like protein n=1 Tax=Striga hermonthica TaxID=68872 RepID=A0A9N7NXU4_STRHE|nr:HVA22-like protein k [Striga hermonthica]
MSRYDVSVRSSSMATTNGKSKNSEGRTAPMSSMDPSSLARLGCDCFFALSNVVVRKACCSVGVVLPFYSTFKAIEARDENEEHKWLMYWAAYGSFSLAEVFTDNILYWCPFYYQMKFAFLVWIQLPYVDGQSSCIS